MELEDSTVHSILSHNAAAYGSDPAIGFQNRIYTWKELDTITDSLAYYFMQKGVGRGMNVGICGSNSINWIFTFLSLTKTGALVVLLNFNYKEEELHHICRYADLDFLCYGDSYKDNNIPDSVRTLEKQRDVKIRRYFSVGNGPDSILSETGKNVWINSLDNDALSERKKSIKTSDDMVMLFTSGTTAEPKGVVLTCFQMLNVIREASEAMQWEKSDRICLALPLFHCFGLSTGLLACLVTGAQLFVNPDFRTRNILGIIEHNRCTILNGVPSLFLVMMNNPDFRKYDLSSIKSGVIAGAGIRKSDYVRIRKAFGYAFLEQSFGQTEASPSITFSDYYNDSVDLKSVSVGKVIPNVELRIADPVTGTERRSFELGEIQIQGFNVMTHGYYKKKEETENAFTKDGWLKTGDLGYLDRENNLYISGRLKDIIIRCGENISPCEIEEQILEYPGVEDALVFGVADSVTQEEIVACIVCSDSFSVDRLRDYLRKKIACYKIPKYICILKKIPLNSSGKINKTELKRVLQMKLKQTGGAE